MSTESTSRLPATGRPDVVLVEEGRRRVGAPAPAQELFTDEVFLRARAYARSTGAAWFVLSGEYGLLAPDQVVAPYGTSLATATPDYRQAWAGFVAARLEALTGPLRRRRVEVHAVGFGAGEALRQRLLEAGALVLEPLRGLPVPDRLAWYAARAGLGPGPGAAPGGPAGSDMGLLADATAASRPSEVLASVDAALRGPGLTSWFVDEEGARHLSEGLGTPVAAGLVWIGQAGGVRPGTGMAGTATLRTQLAWVDLGRSVRLSPLRRVLGGALARVPSAGVASEEALTEWMHVHLGVVALAAAPDGLPERAEELAHRLAPQLSPEHSPDPAVRASVEAARGFDGFPGA